MRFLDIAIIGAGCSGMAAALAARETSPRAAIALFDPSSPGGTALFAPPASPKACEAARLAAALKEQGIAIIPRLVERVYRGHEYWYLSSGDAVLCEARAVIAACGVRALANEAAYLGKGLFHFAKDTAVADDFTEVFAAPETRRVLVVGNVLTERILPMLGQALRDGQEVFFAIDEPAGTALPDVFYRLKLHDGRVISYEGAQRIEAVNLEVRNALLRLPCDAAIVDAGAFAARPSMTLFVDLVERTVMGKIVANAQGSTGIAGIFATGSIACTGVDAKLVGGTAAEYTCK